MAEAIIRKAGELSWGPWRDSPGSRRKTLLDGMKGNPEIFLVELAPHFIAARHSHDQDESYYIVEGEMEFNGVSCPVGTSIHVPKGTVYKLETGSAAAVYLNTRPRKAHILKASSG